MVDYTKAPPPASPFVRNIFLDILFTLLTCFLYNIYLQSVQMNAVNYILKQPKYSFGRWALYCLLTCGLYHIYHEYIMSRDILEANGKKESVELIIHVGLSIMGLHFLVDAVQQNEINKYFGQSNSL